jgi:hypothetical protein
MSHQDWAAFAKGMLAVAATGLAILYFLELRGPFTKAAFLKAHATIWKKPRRWQLITVCALGGFIIAGVVLLVLIQKPN